MSDNWPSPQNGGVDKERIERAVYEILAAIGEDPARDGLVAAGRRAVLRRDDLPAVRRIGTP